MNILDTIIESKREEVIKKKTEKPVAELEQTVLYTRPVLSLKQFLLDDTRTGIIAEFKRKSPSKGIINEKVDVIEVT